MNRLSEFVFRPASVLGFKAESPAFATLFLILRKPRFYIHYNHQHAMKQKMSTKYKITRQHSRGWDCLCLVHFANSCTSLHGVKLSIDT